MKITWKTKTKILRFIARVMGMDCFVVQKGTFPPRPSKNDKPTVWGKLNFKEIERI